MATVGKVANGSSEYPKDHLEGLESDGVSI